MATNADSKRVIFELAFRRRERGPLSPAKCNDLEIKCFETLGKAILHVKRDSIKFAFARESGSNLGVKVCDCHWGTYEFPGTVLLWM